MNGWKNDKYSNGTNRREQDEGINFPNHMDGPDGVKEFAKELVKTYDLGEDKARFSVVSFNTVATTRVPWSYNAAVINAGIDQMSATGKTSISDGFVAAGKLFADDRRAAKKIVLLLSDGEQTVDAAGTYVKCADDNAECHRSKMQIAIDAAALVKGDDVTVFAWGFGESMSDVWKEGLQQIATEKSKSTLGKDLTELTNYL